MIINRIYETLNLLSLQLISFLVGLRTYQHPCMPLARPTSRCILFDGENISFDASLVIYINSTNIPPIMIINRIHETLNLLSLQVLSFLVGLRTYQHPCIALTLKVQCSHPSQQSSYCVRGVRWLVLRGTSSAQRDKTVLHCCQICKHNVKCF